MTPVASLPQDEKAALREELAASDAARDRARDELKAARGALKFRTAEEVGAEIARLEHLMAHTTMPLNEEKKLLTTIKELAKSRDEVKHFGDRSAKLAGGDEARKELVERIRAKDAEITAVRGERTALQATLQAARDKADAHVAGLPAMLEERNKTWEALRAARDAGRAARDAHQVLEDAWWANEKLWRNQQREEKQKRCDSRPECQHAPGRRLTRTHAARAPAGRKARQSARRAPRLAASLRRRTRRSRTPTRRVRRFLPAAACIASRFVCAACVLTQRTLRCVRR